MDDFYKSDPMSLGTKGLVYIGDQLLLYRRDDTAPKARLLIDVPGGGADPGETPFETYKREVKEEFGLDITKDDIIYAGRTPSVFEPGKFFWFAVAKLPKSAKDKIVFGDEGLHYLLMSEQEYLGAKDTWEIYQDRAREYIESK